jgi:hypothetical protein
VALDIPEYDMSHLSAPLSFDKIKSAIALMPKDKSPDPDGFNGHFFCLLLVNHTTFASGLSHNFHILNLANVALLP